MFNYFYDEISAAFLFSLFVKFPFQLSFALYKLTSFMLHSFGGERETTKSVFSSYINNREDERQEGKEISVR